jgi:hypothetical protein
MLPMPGVCPGRAVSLLGGYLTMSEPKRPLNKTTIEVFWRPTREYCSKVLFVEDVGLAVETFLKDAEIEGAVFVDDSK